MPDESEIQVYHAESKNDWNLIRIKARMKILERSLRPQEKVAAYESLALLMDRLSPRSPRSRASGNTSVQDATGEKESMDAQEVADLMKLAKEKQMYGMESQKEYMFRQI